MLIKEEVWFKDEEKDLKMIWEGIFFMFWHSDKLSYQKETANKIVRIFSDLKQRGPTYQKKWFQAFIYIFNIHWDKVDNYRIDKYLMLLRFAFNAVIKFLKESGYSSENLEWFSS
mmetsp:Transcript_29886/g.29052  ORF Transcript_29886/g.29052 Transcript_29886/m.29052 type:complete len:115 (+) Transcript_29886:92-436(+)